MEIYYILWILSTLSWLYFAIRSIIETKNGNNESHDYIIRMWIANIFMWIFIILNKITK